MNPAEKLAREWADNNGDGDLSSCYSQKQESFIAGFQAGVDQETKLREQAESNESHVSSEFENVSISLKRLRDELSAKDLELCRAVVEIERLHEQLERVVKFYGAEVNYSMGDSYKTFDRLENDTEYMVRHGGRYDMISGKLARQVAKEEGIEV